MTSARASTWAALAMVIALARPAVAEPLHDRFGESPFDPSNPRWCERYHHAHWTGGAIRFTPSAPLASECTAGEGPLSSLSCNEAGCDRCDAIAGSPCSKIGDPRGNAILQTTRDASGQRRSIRATFVIERQLPVGGSHLGLYVAFHPHCHNTLQAILVPDRPGVYHLNLAAFNQFIGGDGELYRWRPAFAPPAGGVRNARHAVVARRGRLSASRPETHRPRNAAPRR